MTKGHSGRFTKRFHCYFVVGIIILTTFAFCHTILRNYFEDLKREKRIANDSIAFVLKKQRDELSAKANALAKDYMQYQCRLEDNNKEKKENKDNKEKKEANKETSVSSLGGWCKEAGKSESRQHSTDYKLIAQLATFFTGKTVGSFGDGPGLYKRALDKTGLLKSYTAFDGAPFVETTSDKTVRHLDLTVPAFGLPVFDWVLSLEVAEHIPRQYEKIYLDNLVRHAKEGLVISWAKVGQGGLSHVNNRPLEHVVDRMSELGFALDGDNSKKLRTSATKTWLKNNVNVFRRREDSPSPDPVMA